VVVRLERGVTTLFALAEARRAELRRLVVRSRHAVLLAAATGVATGLVVAGFESLVTTARDRVGELPTAAVAALPAVGLALATIMLRFVARSGSGTADEYIQAFHDGRVLGIRTGVGRFAAALATLGSGAPMGLEGPSLYFGATLGSLFQRRWRRWVDGADRRLLLVAGAAAGVAAVFKAPATGAVFALEVPYQDDLARRMLLPALVASASGYLAFVAFEGTTPILPVEGHPGFAVRDLAAAGCIGVLAGVGARGFAWLVRRAKGAVTRHPATLRIAVAGALLAGTFLVGEALTGQGIVLGSGYTTINWAITTDDTMWIVLGILALRALATVAAVGGGGVGGLFIPLVVTGALLGRVVGEIADPDQLSLFVVVGVAAFLGAGYRVPLAAVMFVAESTGRPGFVVPGLLAAVAAELLMARSSITPYQVWMNDPARAQPAIADDPPPDPNGRSGSVRASPRRSAGRLRLRRGPTPSP
jgi:CIC family chloride channel protein